MKRREYSDREEPGRFAALETQLRSLPAPDAPAHLLDALLRDIPNRPTPGARRKKVWLPLWAAAAAVALVAFIFGRDWADMQPEPERSVSVKFVIHPKTQTQETDPCSIFPPLVDLPHAQPPS
jgi:hypothetical protein